MTFSQQRGIGLIEVIVSLLLLAIAILGFSALQVTSFKATDESLMRTDATTLIEGLSEVMRNNLSHLDAIQQILDGTNSNFNKNCLTSACNDEEQAQYAAKAIKTKAALQDYKVGMITCPGTASGVALKCAIVAWGDTNATQGSNSSSDCLNNSGTYYKRSECLVMETY